MVPLKRTVNTVETEIVSQAPCPILYTQYQGGYTGKENKLTNVAMCQWKR